MSFLSQVQPVLITVLYLTLLLLSLLEFIDAHVPDNLDGVLITENKPSRYTVFYTLQLRGTMILTLFWMASVGLIRYAGGVGDVGGVGAGGVGDAKLPSKS